MSEGKRIEHECYICKTKSDSSYENILKFGQWNIKGDISVHDNCLYFMTGLLQRGANKRIKGANISGFLLKDIRKLVKNAKRSRCKFCEKGSASISCCENRCKNAFHFDCGQQNAVQYKFYGSFESLCPEHYDIIEEKSLEKNFDPKGACLICEEPLGAYHILNIIPSCCKVDFFHRECVQKTAYHQGNDMKCLTCGTKKGDADESSLDRYKNDESMPKKEYIRFLKERGIFVPDRISTYEHETRGYAELNEDNWHIPCNASKCLCTKGRDFKKKTGTWEIIICMICGGNGIHFGCMNSSEKTFTCTDCNHESRNPGVCKTPNKIQGPEPVVEKTIPHPRKVPTAFENKRNQLKRAGDDLAKVWHNMDVECFEGYRKTLVLRPSNEEVDPKPMTTDEFIEHRRQMQNDRLDHFFKNTEFRKSPISRMPAIDHLRLLWAEEAAKKSESDAKKKKTAQKETDKENVR